MHEIHFVCFPSTLFLHFLCVSSPTKHCFPLQVFEIYFPAIFNMISSISLPASTLNCRKLISSSLHITPQQYNNHLYRPHFSLHTVLQTGSSSSHRGCSLVALDGKSSGSSEEDRQALETVLKLYSAIKNKNIHELSNVIADECRCVCNFFSFFQPFQGKKQVVDFLSYLMRSLGNNIEFVVKPTLHDGMNVGLAWRLEWKRNNVALGKGLSFYICQIYQGKVFIRNVEMFMEPLLHIEPFRLKIFGYMITIMDKLSSYHTVSKTMMIKRGFYISLVLFCITLLFFFSKPGLY